MPRPRRLYAVLLGSALVVAPRSWSRRRRPRPRPTSVALVGDLPETSSAARATGSPPAPTPSCPQVGDTALYRATFDVPGGTYAVQGRAQRLLGPRTTGRAARSTAATSRCCSPARRRSRSPTTTTTHARVVLTPVVAEDTTPADAALAEDSLRSSLTRERFYFVMADRFANGSTANDLGGLTGGPLTTGLRPDRTRASTTVVTSRASPRSSTTSRAWAPRPSG